MSSWGCVWFLQLQISLCEQTLKEYKTPKIGPRRALHRRFQSSGFSMHLAGSLVLSTPASSLRRSTFVWMGRPRLRCPRVGSHSTGLLAGSWCLWQCPAGLIPLAAIFWLTLGIPSYRVWVGHMRTLADVKHYMQHSRVAPVLKFLRSLSQVSSIHCHGGEQILQLRRRSWAWFVGGVWNAMDWPRHSGPSKQALWPMSPSPWLPSAQHPSMLSQVEALEKDPSRANLLVFAFNFLSHGKMQILAVQTLIS